MLIRILRRLLQYPSKRMCTRELNEWAQIEFGRDFHVTDLEGRGL